MIMVSIPTLVHAWQLARPAVRRWLCLCCCCAASALLGPTLASASVCHGGAPALQRVYVLGDSISAGLATAGLGNLLQERFGSQVQINHDIGRSITTPGSEIRQSALDALERDRSVIARASVIIVVLGTNQVEPSFAQSQQLLMWQLRTLAPTASYFWVDIGATLANQVGGWSQRNQIIYDNAALLGYRVISRYKAIFGDQADPLALQAGKNFPGYETEPGFGVAGNLHGADDKLAQAVVAALRAAVCGA